MKTIVKMILPVAVFVLASAGAVSTNGEKAASKKAATDQWIRINNSPQNCEEVDVNCTTENTAQLCMDITETHQVFQKDGSLECTIPLYKVID